MGLLLASNLQMTHFSFISTPDHTLKCLFLYHSVTLDIRKFILRYILKKIVALRIPVAS